METAAFFPLKLRLQKTARASPATMAGSTEPKVQISVILTVGQISLKISWKFFIPTNFPAEEPVKPVKALNSTVTRE